MAWPKGFSWTKGQWEDTTNPDQSISKMYVHAGPFLWLPIQITKQLRIEIYAGFRPTPTWGVGYGNEGDGKLFTKIGQWMKNKGRGNLGFAFRFKKSALKKEA